MNLADAKALEQAQKQSQPNGQPRPTQQPSDGVAPIPAPITVGAARAIAAQSQGQFNELVVGFYVQGFYNSAYNGLGPIGQAIAEEGSLSFPLNLKEFRQAIAQLPPAGNQ